MFSDKTLACLRAAGWSEDYRTDITPYQQAAEADGSPLPEIVTAFLTRFGGLKITYLHRQRYDFFFLGGDCAPIREDLEWMAEKIGVDSVFSIGRLRDEGDLLMDLEGKVYLFFGSSKGGEVQLVASSGEEALEILCADKRATTIKSW